VGKPPKPKQEVPRQPTFEEARTFAFDVPGRGFNQGVWEHGYYVTFPDGGRHFVPTKPAPPPVPNEEECERLVKAFAAKHPGVPPDELIVLYREARESDPALPPLTRNNFRKWAPAQRGRKRKGSPKNRGTCTEPRF
jgi:hypothetical protein